MDIFRPSSRHKPAWASRKTDTKARNMAARSMTTTQWTAPYSLQADSQTSETFHLPFVTRHYCSFRQAGNLAQALPFLRPRLQKGGM
jgi:hypothetical protein